MDGGRIARGIPVHSIDNYMQCGVVSYWPLSLLEVPIVPKVILFETLELYKNILCFSRILVLYCIEEDKYCTHI